MIKTLSQEEVNDVLLNGEFIENELPDGSIEEYWLHNGKKYRTFYNTLEEIPTTK